MNSPLEYRTEHIVVPKKMKATAQGVDKNNKNHAKLKNWNVVKMKNCKFEYIKNMKNCNF